jgi:CO dehydrogenase/acetyl-CoA synthase gamma subunit (corrinoid Fe-S protein)
MKVTELSIKRYETYESKPGQLYGKVTIDGDEGTQRVNLSFKSLNAIFSVVADEVSEQAKANAKLAKRALQDAMDEPLTLEADGVLKISADPAEEPF